MATFSDHINSGNPVPEKAFDDAVSQWESGDQSRPVSEHLGLDSDEFAYICMSTEDWNKTVENIRLKRNSEEGTDEARQV